MGIMNNLTEYGNVPVNIFNNDNEEFGAAMTDSDVQTTYKKRNGMKVIFEFPAKSKENEELIKMEVRSIMQNALYEQLHNPLLS